MVLLLVIVAALPVMAFAKDMTMYVYTANGGALNLREQPSQRSNTIVKIPFGDPVLVKGATGDPSWVAVTWSDKNGTQYNGYCMGKFLQASAPSSRPNPSKSAEDITSLNSIFGQFKPVAPGEYVYVSLVKASGYGAFRWAPTKQSRLISKLPDGYKLRVIAKAKQWYQVEDEATGMVGFIFNSYLQK